MNKKKYGNKTQRSLIMAGVLAAGGILLTLSDVGESLVQQASATTSYVVSGKTTFLPCYGACGKLVLLPSTQSNIDMSSTILIPLALVSSSLVLGIFIIYYSLPSSLNSFVYFCKSKAKNLHMSNVIN